MANFILALAVGIALAAANWINHAVRKKQNYFEKGFRQIVDDIGFGAVLIVGADGLYYSLIGNSLLLSLTETDVRTLLGLGSLALLYQFGVHFGVIHEGKNQDKG